VNRKQDHKPVKMKSNEVGQKTATILRKSQPKPIYEELSPSSDSRLLSSKKGFKIKKGKSQNNLHSPVATTFTLGV